MCIEYVCIAFCAETRRNSLTFICGKFHTIASKREVCLQAKGQCPCYFATCGTITKITSTEPVDMALIPKVRCAPCTTREDKIGERRHGLQLIDCPHLNRLPVPENKWPEHLATLRRIWNAEKCTYHVFYPAHPVKKFDPLKRLKDSDDESSEEDELDKPKGEWGLKPYEYVPAPWADMPLSSPLSGMQIPPIAFRAGNKENVKPMDDENVLRVETKLTKENLARVPARFENKKIDMPFKVKPHQMRTVAPVEGQVESNSEENHREIQTPVVQNNNDEINIDAGPKVTATKATTNADNNNKATSERVPLLQADSIKAWLAGH